MVSINFNGRNLYAGLNTNANKPVISDQKIGEFKIKEDLKCDGFTKSEDTQPTATTMSIKNGSGKINGKTWAWEKLNDGDYCVTKGKHKFIMTEAALKKILDKNGVKYEDT